MQNNKKIGHILFYKIFIGYVFIATIFTSYHIFIEYSSAKEFVLKEMQTIEKAFYHGIANSVWHLDEEQINDNTRAIESIQGIIGISIITNNNEVLSQIGKLALADKKYTTFLYEENENITFQDNLIKHSFDISHEEFSPGESLGTVFIYTSENAIYSIIKESLIFILIYNSMIIIVLWILLSYFSNKLLTDPLNQIIQATKDLNIKEYQEISLDIRTSKKSELDTLVDTFNIMSKRIVESFSKLKEQKRDLIEANQYQTDFLANVSHEFKTPLNSINIISSIMSKNTENNLNAKQINNMQIINKSGKDLLGMINDILDMSKLEAGKLQLNLEIFSIQELLTDLYERMNPLAKEKEITFTQESTLKENIITSDKKIITHVIENLLSNAIKFTKTGGIELKISKKDQFIIINVIDTGIGIPKNKIEKVFDRFKQVDGSTNRKFGGTGLGLAISKDFALFIKGKLTVKSELSKGSDFQFSFPKKSILEEEIIDKTIKEEIKYDILDDISEPVEKTEIEILIEDEEFIQKEVINVVLLNSNPVVFFSLIVTLKKQENLNFIAINNEKELISKLEKNTKSILIIDSVALNSNIKNCIKNRSNIKVIGIGDNNENNKYIDSMITKPLDIESILKLCSK